MAWLCSLPSTMWYLASPFGSFLTNKYGCRACAFIGGVFAAIGLCLSFFATDTGYLFFSHGLLMGFGFSINFTASTTVLNTYFDKYKTITTGIASVGYNMGLVIYAKVIIYLQEMYGWREMMLIHGAIAFNLCACALAMFPLKTEVSQNAENIQKIGEHHKNSPKVRKSINLSVFKKLSFISYCVSNIFTNCGYGIYMLQLPSYSKEAGFSQNEFGTVLIVFGITNVVGKIICSFVCQHPRSDVTAIYAISMAAAGISSFLTPFFLTKAGMVTLAGLVGLFFCVNGALLQAVVFRIVGFDKFADGVGMSLPFKAVGNLIGGPVAGFLFASTGSYAYSFYLAGACLVVCSVFMIQPTLHHGRREKMHQSNNIYTVSDTDVDSNARILNKSKISNGSSNGKVNETVVDNTQRSRFEQIREEENESFLNAGTV